MMPMMLRKALMVGRTPGSARDALVPLPGQRRQHLTRREQADGGVGRGPGGPPHHQWKRLLPLAALLTLGIPASHAQNPQLDCNQPVDVTLAAGLPQAFVTFSGSAGETVYIRLLAKSVDPGFGLAPVVVVDPFGNIYNPRSQDPTVSGATPGDLTGVYANRAFLGWEFDLPTDGIFTLRLIGSNSNAGASLHIVLARINRPCSANTTLTCGHSIAGAISTSLLGQVDTYQFSVQTGDVVRFRLLRVATSGLPNTNTGFFFAVYAADPAQNNRPYAVNVDPTTKRLTFASLYNFYDWTATITGTVTVMVFEFTGNLGGSYYVSATRLNGGCGGASLTCNSTVDGVLTSPLTYGSYTIQANGGDVYQFRAARPGTSGGFTPGAEIFNSNGTRVGVLPAASPVGHAASTSTITFPTSGTYSVLVSGPLDGSLGSYSLSTLRLNRPCDGATALSCSSVVDGSVSGLIRNQIYSLSASAKDSYLVRLLRPDANSLFRPRLDIYDPTGASVQFLNTNDLARVNFTVPSDGLYTLVVTDSYDGSQSGSYSLSLLRLNRPCGAGTLSCGAPSAGSFPRALASSVDSYTAAAGESFSVRMLPGSPGQRRGPAPLRQLRRRRRDQAGGRHLHGGRHRCQQDALCFQFHARLAAHRQRLLRARGTGHDGEWSSLGHGPVSDVWHRGFERRRARPAQQLFHGRLRLPDGTLRSRRRAPGCRRLQSLPHGRRVRHVYRNPGCGGAAHRGRIQLRLAAPEPAGRRIAPSLRCHHRGRALPSQSVPLLHPRRQRRRYPAADLHQHRR